MMVNRVLDRNALCLILLVGIGLCLLSLEDFRSGVRQVVISVPLASSVTKDNSIGYSGTVKPASAVLCNRIQLPDQYYNESQGPYNPAAIRHPKTGEWTLVFTYDECWYGISEYARTGKYLLGRMRSHPLLVRLGNGTMPDFALAEEEDNVVMMKLDQGFKDEMLRHRADVFKAADWRPFMWKGEVHLGHWIGFLPAQERMSISRADLATNTVHFIHRFTNLSSLIEESPRGFVVEKARGALISRSMMEPHVPKFKREKNWGFVDDGGRLLIFYSLLPCLVVLEFEPSLPDGARLHSRYCYEAQASSIAHATGLDLFDFEMHSSGNPTPWDVEHGDDFKEYVSMLHVKKGDYTHWAVRIDRHTKQMTHISAGPVIKARDFRNEGFLDTALVVSSFHVGRQGDGEPLQLRILYGEGDRYGCWLDIPTRNIVWHPLSPALPAMYPRFPLSLRPLQLSLH
eukprot:jgi/Botrbrau1/17351/Bobra.0015s0095.1